MPDSLVPDLLRRGLANCSWVEMDCLVKAAKPEVLYRALEDHRTNLDQGEGGRARLPALRLRSRGPVQSWAMKPLGASVHGLTWPRWTPPPPCVRAQRCARPS